MNSLVDRSVYILREANAKFKNPAVLWSTGKDSTAILSLMKEAFFNTIPYPLIHIDTGFDFKEVLDFRDQLIKDWGMELIVAKSDKKVNPFSFSRFDCCHELKTNALKDVIREHKFDAIIVSIRRDEHGIRSMERVVSPRDKEFRWKIYREKTEKTGDSGLEAIQDAEVWDFFASDFGPDCDHVRVHPILHWTELEIWEYTKLRNLPINPLYFAKDGKRYRSLGCWSCTIPIESNAQNIDEIIRELETTKEPERKGRNTEKENIMENLRAIGYC